MYVNNKKAKQSKMDPQFQFASHNVSTTGIGRPFFRRLRKRGFWQNDGADEIMHAAQILRHFLIYSFTQTSYPMIHNCINFRLGAFQKVPCCSFASASGFFCSFLFTKYFTNNQSFSLQRWLRWTFQRNMWTFIMGICDDRFIFCIF